MDIFAKIFNRLLEEDVMASTAFGPAATGDTGGQFPAQNSKGFNPGDNRPIDPYKAILGYKSKKKKKKQPKIPMQRRAFSGL